MRFRAAPAGTIRVVPLDGLTAIYHRRSGQTHVVAEPVPQLLLALDEPGTLEELSARLGLSSTRETQALLSERVAELCATGLVTAT